MGRKVSDLGFAEFMSILEIKADQRGKKVIKIDRFDPSSQTGSLCEHRQSITLSQRRFVCLGCGSVKGREHNVARNIKGWGINSGLESVRRSKSASLA